MPSERVQRQIDRLLDEAEAAIVAEQWETVQSRARSALALDPENADAQTYLTAADRSLRARAPTRDTAASVPSAAIVLQPTAPAEPASFAAGRYAVLLVLGQGGMGAVYQVRDTALDRICALKTILPPGSPGRRGRWAG